MKDREIILVINPGSTSTKTALYDREQLLKEVNIAHSREDLAGCGKSVIDQLDYRSRAVMDFLSHLKTETSSLSCIMARGGLLKPLPGGIYRINQAMLEDLEKCAYGTHASNLGALIADRLGSSAGISAFIADPVVVDELAPLSRYSGHPDITRRSIFHALNQKAVCRKAAADSGKKIEESVFIVAHMGGGISIGIHAYGKVTDVTNALDGEGPFTPERAGSLPVLSFMRFAEKNGINAHDAETMLNRHGGLYAYLGTNDLKEIEERAVYDTAVMEVVEAMAYQISKSICSLAAFTCGNVDGIALTGGLSNSKLLTGMINRRVKFLAPVYLYPQSSEMDALASCGAAAISGKAEILEYLRSPQE